MPLLVATKIGQSSIAGAGAGVFAAEPIKKGQLIWQLEKAQEIFFSETDLAALSTVTEERLRELVYYSEQLQTFVLCSDNACYMNHSDSPNCDDPDDYITLANRDIAVGEELTVDYRAYDAPGYDNVLRAAAKQAKTSVDATPSSTGSAGSNGATGAPYVSAAEAIIQAGKEGTPITGAESGPAREVLDWFAALDLVEDSRWIGLTKRFHVKLLRLALDHGGAEPAATGKLLAAGQTAVGRFVERAIAHPQRSLLLSELGTPNDDTVRQAVDILCLLGVVLKHGKYYSWIGWQAQ